MRVAFCTAEAFPFAKVGGLADVCGALPLALEKLGEEVVLILPGYKTVEKSKFGIKRLTDNFSTTTIGKNVRVYFIESEKYFGRPGIYGNESGGYPDNLERYQYYSAKVFDLLKFLNLKVDVLHCHDWHAALIPVYLKFLHKSEPFFSATKSILTIHNLGYQGIFPKQQFDVLGLDWKLFNREGFEFFDQVNVLKGGIIFSDMVSTVSPQYAKEIQTEEFGCGLNGVLHSRQDSVAGILNGVDYEVWDPRKDDLIPQKYSKDDLAAKKINKRQLQELAGLDTKEDIPLFGYVGRLSFQKGLDLLAKVMDQLVQMDLQIVLQGLGEEKYHKMLLEMVKAHGKKISLFLQFDEKTAHMIYAGSDFFLMPSQYEPCGLGQIISLKYGTIPVVNPTGGLADTISPADLSRSSGNGFLLKEYHREALLQSFGDAQAAYKDKRFKELMTRAMGYDFSWSRSAKQYQDLYQRCSALG